jgi:hypothetical protein
MQVKGCMCFTIWQQQQQHGHLPSGSSSAPGSPALGVLGDSPEGAAGGGGATRLAAQRRNQVVTTHLNQQQQQQRASNVLAQQCVA